MQPRIFLSYSWANKDIADTIDDDWQAVGLTLIRDVRDLEYKQNIKDFMMRVNDSDYVLLLISDGYLKSKNCMYEALVMFQDAEFKKKILPILTDDARIHNSIDRIEYISYWDHKAQELENKIKILGSLSGIKNVQEELNDYIKVRSSLDEFISEISSMLCLQWPKAKEDSYREIFNHIGFDDNGILQECSRILAIEDLEDKEIAIDELLYLNPNNINVLTTKASIHFHDKKFKRSMAIIKKLIDIDPNDALAHYNLSVIYDQHIIDKDLARKHLEISLSIDENNASAHNNLASLLIYNFNNPELAKEHLLKSIDIEPTNVSAYGNLASLYEKYYSNYEEAKLALEKVIEFDPSKFIAYVMLAKIQAENLNNREDAVVLLRKAKYIKSDNSSTNIRFANLLFKLSEDPNEAIDFLKEWVEVNDPDEKIYTTLGIMYRKIEKLEQSELYFHNALKINHEYAIAHLNIALTIYQNAERHEEAEMHYKIACDLDQDLKKEVFDDLFNLNS